MLTVHLDRNRANLPERQADRPDPRVPSPLGHVPGKRVGILAHEPAEKSVADQETVLDPSVVYLNQQVGDRPDILKPQPERLAEYFVAQPHEPERDGQGRALGPAQPDGTTVFDHGALQLWRI